MEALQELHGQSQPRKVQVGAAEQYEEGFYGELVPLEGLRAALDAGKPN